jgi:hypothetical protein
MVERGRDWEHPAELRQPPTANRADFQVFPLEAEVERIPRLDPEAFAHDFRDGDLALGSDPCERHAWVLSLHHPAPYIVLRKA